MAGLVTETRDEIRRNELVILSGLGISLDNDMISKAKHGPCPNCGGTDRFRIKLNAPKPFFLCNGCHPRRGDMLDLIMLIEGLPDVTAAAMRARELLGLPARFNGAMSGADREKAEKRRAELRANAEAETRRREAEEKAEAARLLRVARLIWQDRRQMVGTPAARYWAGRSLGALPLCGNIEFLPARGDRPCAMIAAFCELDREGFPRAANVETVHGIHMTRLTPEGRKVEGEAKVRIGRGHSLPIVVSMGDEGNETLVICEGIEDAASVAASTPFAAWASCAANRMAGLAEHIPAWVRRVVLVEDDNPDVTDRNGIVRPGAGPEGVRRAAEAVAARGIVVLIERGGDKVEGSGGLRRQDLNDTLKKNGPEAVKDRLGRAIPFAKTDGISDASKPAEATKDDLDTEPNANDTKGDFAIKPNAKGCPDIAPNTKDNIAMKDVAYAPEGGKPKNRPPLQVVPSDDDGNNMRDGKPVIRVEAGQLHSMATAAQELLVAAGVEVFVRGDELVVPASRVVINARGEQIQAPFLGTVSADAMRDLLSEHIAWEKWDERKKAWVTAHPPKDVVDTIMSRRGRWKFAHIAGIIGTPTLRYDGSLLSDEGYDKKTSLYVMNAAKIGAMPAKPSREDAMAAIDLLKGDVLADFPFVMQEGETLERNAALSVALSILITPVVRGCMNVAPMHAVSAPTKGTGKSMLFDSSAMISLGTTCPAISVGKKDEETEKRISSEALAGAPIINIDNVNGTLGGDQLCQLVTQEICKIRILGRSETPSIMNRFCMFANGNNILLTEDMTRRAVLCGLDAGIENPSERDFQGRNPVKTIGRDRGRYIAACLTIVRAYILAGRPDVGCQSWGSFEDWTNSVRGALVWCGEADPYETTKIVQADDPHAARIACMFTGMKQAGAVHEWGMKTVKQLWEEAVRTHSVGDGDLQNPDLHDALAQFRTASGFNANAAGMHMRSLLNKVIGGHKLCCKKSRTNSMCWYLQPL